jgi:tripartite-type tricarboxylate transporter receptor subunit TctC
MHLTDFLRATVVASFAFGLHTQAADHYPTKPVRVIVGSAAGGGSDFIVRPIVQIVGERLGQTFVVDNRAGASGIIAMELTAKAPPDGYTILLGTVGNFATNYAIYDKLPYDPIKDYAPITKLVDSPFILTVHPSMPVSTVREFVAHAKSNPGKVTYASFGVGSFSHLLSEEFAERVGIRITHVPYKGSAPAMIDLVAGQVQCSFDSMQSAMPQVRAKRLRALAIGSDTRSPVAPDVQTFTEAGYPFDTSGWYGMFAPAGTPQAIITKLHEEIVRALKSAEVRERIESTGAYTVGNRPEEFARQIKSDIARYVKVARSRNIRAE